MKYGVKDPSESRGEHHKMDAGEDEAEYDQKGNVMKGGGY